MNPQKKIGKREAGTNNINNNNNNNTSNFPRKPRRSIKVEGNCLNKMLREGLAKVIDASKLGKRLSSEIWNSFGAIQVEDNFTYPSIDTKTVADGTSTLKICQFFVACSKCFSVFKYDGHAYGTTGLVKHVKICQGTNQRGATTNYISNPNANIDQQQQQQQPTIDTTHTSSSSSVPTTTKGPTRRKKEPDTSNKTQPSLRHLAKVVEELRSEQCELKQKIHEMINLISGTSYLGQIQIISNDKVVDELQQKTD